MQALCYYTKAQEYDNCSIGNSIQSICYSSRGAVYNSQKNFTESVSCFEKGLAIAKEVGDRTSEAKCYSGLGYAYLSQENFVLAVDYYKKTLLIAKEIGDRYIELECYIHLGATFENLGDSTNAKNYYEKALRQAKELGELNKERVVYSLLGHLSIESNPEAAFEYSRKSVDSRGNRHWACRREAHYGI